MEGPPFLSCPPFRLGDMANEGFSLGQPLVGIDMSYRGLSLGKLLRGVVCTRFKSARPSKAQLPSRLFGSNRVGSRARLSAN